MIVADALSVLSRYLHPAADHTTDKLLALIAAGVLWNLVAHLRHAACCGG